MTKVLRYFDIGGLAEAIRYIFYHTDQKFEDVRYDLKKWPDNKIKNALPFGQLPIYEEGERILNQSMVIARYAAANTELLPTGVWEQAQLDAIVLTIYDFHKHIVNVVHAKNPEDKEALRKKLFEEHVHFYFSRLEKKLQENNGYFNGKLSWAEFILVGIIENGNLALQAEIQHGYPNIIKLIETVTGLPRVKEYIKTRKPYVLPKQN